MPAQTLTDSGFLVTPVLAGAARPAFPAPANLAEVDAIFDVPLLDRAAAPPLEDGSYGPMTAAVLDLLEHMLTARPRITDARRSGQGPRSSM